MHTYIHTFILTLRTSVITYIHTYKHSSIHTYIHTYIHAYIHSFIHTYIHTFNIPGRLFYRWYSALLAGKEMASGVEDPALAATRPKPTLRTSSQIRGGSGSSSSDDFDGSSYSDNRKSVYAVKEAILAEGAVTSPMKGWCLTAVCMYVCMYYVCMHIPSTFLRSFALLYLTKIDSFCM